MVSPLDILNKNQPAGRDRVAPIQEEPGAFMSFLQWLDRPFQVVGAGVQGDFGRAGRHLLDFVGEIPDAFLPGDLIPQATSAQDFMDPSELLGLDDAPWYAKLPTDILLGTALNPLSFLSFGGAGAAASVGKAAGKADDLIRAVGKTSGQGSVADTAAAAARGQEYLHNTLQRQLTRQGAKSGKPSEIADEMLAAANAADDPIDALTSAVRADARFEPGGIQYGIPFGPKATLATGDQVSDFMGRTGGAIAERLPDPVLGALSRAGGAMGAVGAKAKSYLGFDDPAALATSRTVAETSGERSGQVWTRLVKERFRDEPEEIRKALNQVVNNYQRGPDGYVLLHGVGAPAFSTSTQQVNRLLAAAKSHPALETLSEPKLRDLFTKYDETVRGLFQEDIAKGVMQRPQAFITTDGQALDTWQVLNRFEEWNPAGMQQSVGELQALKAELQLADDALESAMIAAGSAAKGLRKDRRKMEKQLGREYSPDLADDINNAAYAGHRATRDADSYKAMLADRIAAQKKLDDFIDQHEGFQTFLQDQGINHIPLPDEFAPSNYLPRYWDRIDPQTEQLLSGGAGANFLRSRTLKDQEAFLKKLNESGAVLEEDVYKSLTRRAQAQGKAVTRATFARSVLGDDAVLANPVTATHLNRIADELKTMGSPEMGRWVDGLIKGQPPPGPVVEILARANRQFKKAATMGILLPRVAFNVRNKLSHAVGQTPAVKEGNVALAAQRIVPDIAESLVEALRPGLSNSAISKSLRALDDAFAAARTPDDVLRLLREAGELDMVEAVQHGVLQNFVTTEGLMTDWLGRMGPRGQNIQSWLDMPARWANGVEQRMRMVMYQDLRRKGYSPSAAADITRDIALDYRRIASNPGNSTIRAVVPFAQFTLRSIPQQAQWMAREPAVGTAMAQLFGGERDEPVMPWIAEQPSFQVGRKDDGTTNYVTSLGLPIEAMNVIPQFSGDLRGMGRDIERDTIGSSQPLFKTAYGYLTGRDAYFGSTFGSYNKAPAALQALGADEYGEAGRLYNILRGTGLIQPIDTPMTALNRIADDRLNPLEKLLTLTTGARIQPNDPDRAAVQILQERLATDPTVKTHRSYYGGDDETDALIKALGHHKRALREKQQATMQSGATVD